MPILPILFTEKLDKGIDIENKNCRSSASMDQSSLCFVSEPIPTGGIPNFWCEGAPTSRLRRQSRKGFLTISLKPDHYRPQGEGNVFTGVYLSTIGLMATRSLLGLVTTREVHILLECFLVSNTYE